MALGAPCWGGNHGQKTVHDGADGAETDIPLIQFPPPLRRWESSNSCPCRCPRHRSPSLPPKAPASSHSPSLLALPHVFLTTKSSATLWCSRSASCDLDEEGPRSSTSPSGPPPPSKENQEPGGPPSPTRKGAEREAGKSPPTPPTRIMMITSKRSLSAPKALRLALPLPPFVVSQRSRAGGPCWRRCWVVSTETTWARDLDIPVTGKSGGSAKLLPLVPLFSSLATSFLTATPPPQLFRS